MGLTSSETSTPAPCTEPDAPVTLSPLPARDRPACSPPKEGFVSAGWPAMRPPVTPRLSVPAPMGLRRWGALEKERGASSVLPPASTVLPPPAAVAPAAAAYLA